MRALVVMHHRRPRLKRVMKDEEERLGGGPEDFAFRPGQLGLLQKHKSEIATPYLERRSASAWLFCGLWPIRGLNPHN